MAVQTERSSGAAASDPFAGARILVVDDEPANIELLRAVLQGAGDMDVVAVTDSSRAVELVQGCDPTSSCSTCTCRRPRGSTSSRSCASGSRTAGRRFSC
jgi:PleD family two-component response regulator